MTNDYRLIKNSSEKSSVPSQVSFPALRASLEKVIPDLPEDVEVDLFEGGFIDSFRLIEVLTALEDAFSVNFGPDDVGYENISTLRKMHQTIERLAGGQG
jgi:acyl carrier protein